eukprot:1215541-Prymnesium_polylepis.1
MAGPSSGTAGSFPTSRPCRPCRSRRRASRTVWRASETDQPTGEDRNRLKCRLLLSGRVVFPSTG